MYSKIKAVLICIGRFHHFDLARELLKRDMLEQLFTGYPTWKLRGEDIPPNRVKTFPWLQTPYMALAKWRLLGHGRFEREMAWHAHEMLDSYVANNLPQSQILFALSGSGLKSGKAIKARDGRFICDRGSSHIRFQDLILRDEFSRWGDEFRGVDPRIIAKEEAEYESCDILTVPSSFAFRTFIEMGVPDHKLRIVPYGVDLRRFQQVGEPSRNRFEVLFVGRVSFRKGIPYLLEAFKRFSHPNKILTIIGSLTPEVKRYLIQNYPSENVCFLGQAPQPKLRHFMSRSQVMVLPSIEEGLALVQAQALACGCPVIGTTNTGAEDLFTNGVEGFIVPIRDAQSIAERLQELADNPEKRQAMSAAALTRVRDWGGWHVYGEQMSAIFQETVNGAQTSRP